VSKSVIDYKLIPICYDRVDLHGTVRRVYLIYHNYGTYQELTQIKMGLLSGEIDDIKKWRFQT
jgi:hypothetical protein